mgnify:CR=1 FL=1|tara:strand:+ start:182 stop:1351 length:1170 start_codon:yes stop_codon:yes gene_type:complete
MNRYKKIWLPKSLVIVFFEFKDGSAHLSALKILKKDLKNSPNAAQNFDALEDVVKFFGTSTPYAFHVLGTGVLSRKIETSPNFKDDLIINGNIDDFIFTSFNDTSNIAVSFFRKDLIQKELEQASDMKIHLLSVSSAEVPLFNILNNQQVAFSFIISKEEERILEFKQNESKKNKSLWNNKLYSIRQLLAIALLSNLRNENEFYSLSNHEANEVSLENFSQFNQFKTFGVASLLLIFLSLFVNYFYQNNLNDQVAELEMELSISNDNLNLLDRLEQEKSRKQQLILSAGVNSSKFLSFYLDQIGKTVPKSIQLQKLNLFPLESKLKNKQKIEVNQSSILVSGTSVGNEVLDNWIEKMDRFEWVKSIELLNYLKNSTAKSEFNILITISN